MPLATLSDYVGFSILWAIPLLSASKAGMMLRRVTQTVSGRLIDTTEKRDKGLEEKIKLSNTVFQRQTGIENVKIIEMWNPQYSYVAGYKNQAVMLVIPGLDLVDYEALQWLYKQRSYYLINHVSLKVQIIKILSMTIAAVSCNLMLGLGFLPSIFFALLAGFCMETFCKHVVENRADHFALIHSSVEERKGGLRFLKAAYQEQKKEVWLQRVVKTLLYPSYPLRIRKIKKALERDNVMYAVEEDKVASLNALLHKNNIEELSFIEVKKQQVLRWIDADED